MRASGATPLRLSLLREGAPVNVDVTPNVSPAGEGRIGVQLEANAEMTKRVARNAAEGAGLAAKEFGRLAALVSKSLFSLVSDFESAKENVSGPIAIVGVGAEVMRTSDLSGLYQFASVININLAVVNILPLPALDGGFLFLIAVEALRGGKKLPTEVEQSITASGVLLLLGSGMFLILRDTLNLFEWGALKARGGRGQRHAASREDRPRSRCDGVTTFQRMFKLWDPLSRAARALRGFRGRCWRRAPLA